MLFRLFRILSLFLSYQSKHCKIFGDTDPTVQLYIMQKHYYFKFLPSKERPRTLIFLLEFICISFLANVPLHCNQSGRSRAFQQGSCSVICTLRYAFRRFGLRSKYSESPTKSSRIGTRQHVTVTVLSNVDLDRATPVSTKRRCCRRLTAHFPLARFSGSGLPSSVLVTGDIGRCGASVVC